MPDILFLGLGYSVRPLAEELARDGWHVTGTTRDKAKAMTIAASGIKPRVWAAPDPLPAEPIEEADVIVISTGPDDDGCPAEKGIPPSALYGRTQLIYLSSSGVYGDHDGAWIDENAPCRPETKRGKERLAAEHAWQNRAVKAGNALTLCRLAGIYGPGRSAIDSLSGDTPGARAGLSRRTIKPGQVFNRIHRDDIARGLKALLLMDSPPDVINFCDDHPSPPADPITFAAELLGIEPPPAVNYDDIKDELSPMAQSFYAENKRLKNDRLRALPGFSLKYPSFREGLAAIAAAR